jgi:superfamily II DNA or RNA helicase
MLAGSFAVWAEPLGPYRAAHRSLTVRGATGRRGERSGLERRGETYGLDARALRALLAGAFGPAVVSAPPIVDALARLPTRGGSPVPSFVLDDAMRGRNAAAPAVRGRATLEPWNVRAAVLEGDAAIALLGACAGRELVSDEVRVGRDLAYWVAVLRFAAELVAAQHVLPGLASDSEPNVARARWQPVFNEADRRRAARLAAAMPPAARALEPARTTPPRTTGAAAPPPANDSAAMSPANAAESVLAAALECFVDWLMRAGAPLPPPMRAASAVPLRQARPPASLHGRWLDALRAPDGTFAATAAECAGLAAQIEAWRRPVLEERASAYRLCLRVEEPSEDDDAERWNVAYLLQSRVDPSLLLDAAQAARNAALRRELLAALGRAAGHSAHVDGTLGKDGAVPDGFTLDTAGAFAFLTGDASRFEAADVGVILPSWWLGKDAKARIGLRAAVKRPKFEGGGVLRAGSFLDVDWSLALGGEPLNARELQRLAKLKSPLVKLRGRWIHVDANELRSALERVQKGGTRTLSLGDAVRLSLGGAVDGTPAGTTIVAAGETGELLARLRGETSLEPIAPPAGLHAELRPYQQRGYGWLRFLTRAGFGACLADDMGLGKTIQTLALIARDWEEAPGEPVLLVCPTSVIENWNREAQRFLPGLPVHVHHGSARERGAQFANIAKKHALIVTGYALLYRDLALFEKVRWRGVVLDEAQNVKNADSKQAQAARALASGYRVALTGTPVENHVGDLWSLMEFLNPGLLGSAARFRREFFIPIQALGDAAASERLRAVSGPFVLRRLKTDSTIISDLPQKQEYKVFCTLTREQATLYAAVLRDFDKTLEETAGIERRGKILAALSKLKQICNHPAQFAADNSPLPGRSGKLARLEEMLDEVLDAGDGALVFTQFAEMGALIVRRLQQRFGREVAFLHGGVPRAARDAMVERFSRAQGPAVFVLSLKAGGSGLNLTRANHVFHYDRWWNPAVENQATDRAFRIGQTKAVQVHKFVCAGTLEEKIDELIERKAAVSERVVGSGEGWLTELSSAQLRDLVKLSAEAVEAR